MAPGDTLWPENDWIDATERHKLALNAKPIKGNAKYKKGMLNVYKEMRHDWK